MLDLDTSSSVAYSKDSCWWHGRRHRASSYDPAHRGPYQMGLELAASYGSGEGLPANLPDAPVALLEGFVRQAIDDHVSVESEDILRAHFPDKPYQDALVIMRCLVRLGVRGRTELDDDGGFWLDVPVGSPADSRGTPRKENPTHCSYVVRQGNLAHLTDTMRGWLDDGATEWDLTQATDLAIALKQDEAGVTDAECACVGPPIGRR